MERHRTSPVDLIAGAGILSGAKVPATSQLTLAAGSETSVSAVNNATGVAVTIPYGTNPDGNSWIDPTGTDITVSGVPGKTINISGVNVSEQAGSAVDINGGAIFMPAAGFRGLEEPGTSWLRSRVSR